MSNWPSRENSCLVLAPMEGVTDFPMRALLTELGGFDYCVAEFLRVSQNLPPTWIMQKHVPEIMTEGKTASGTPVQFQLLGGDAEKLAASALTACELGAPAIDLNFGCPAPTVNRHDGGATLLKYPARIREIVSAVRRAVPASIPVSAKLRLGWEKLDDILVNAENAVLGGASWITIHARTRVQGYAPPVHWHWIGEVRKRVDIPVIANGDIWSEEDFRRCREITGCQHFMLGRGALGNPLLPLSLKRGLTGAPRPTVDEWIDLFTRFDRIGAPHYRSPLATLRRVKQWANMAHRGRELTWFDTIKRCESLPQVLSQLSERNFEVVQ